MKKTIYNQIINSITSFGALFTVAILVLLICGNYVLDLKLLSGTDKALLYQPLKLSLISFNNTNLQADYILLFRMVFPILSIMPSGFSYINDEKTGIKIYLISRLGAKRYIIEKIVSSFVTTFIVFLIPFVIEMVLLMITYPIGTKCDLSNWGIYSLEYIHMVENYYWPSLYRLSPVLYAILGIVRISMFAGLLSVLAIAISYAFRLKFRFLLFIPIYVLVNITTYFDSVVGYKGKVLEIYHYLFLYNDSPKSWNLYAIYIEIIVIMIILFLIIGERKRRIYVDT